MELTLSRDSSTNTVISNSEGVPLYKIETPTALVGRITTISRVLPEESVPIDSQSSVHSEAGSKECLLDTNTKFTQLMQIEWHWLRATKLRFGGVEMALCDYMRQGGFLEGLVRRYRIFNGPDGRSYIWKLYLSCCSLKLNDGSKTPVARSHREQLGIIGKPRKARLEIFEAGIHMVDTIVTTFAIVETLRRDEADTP